MTDNNIIPRTELPQPLMSELRALREQVQTQHGLIAAFTGRLGNRPRSETHHIRELADPLPVYPGRTGGETQRTIPAYVPPAPSVPHADSPWWPTAAFARPSLHPVPGWALYGHQGPLKAIGFSVSGLDPAGVRAAVEFVARAQLHQRNFVPVFITDLDDLCVFRDHGFVAERIGANGFGPTELAARRELIQRKWNLSTVLDMCRSARPDLASLAATASPADRSQVSIAAEQPAEPDRAVQTAS